MKHLSKFWNIASVNDEEGEIILYGPIRSQKPIDFWTGEPAKGLYITPEGFLEDLEIVKNKSKINLKINSCGGDYFTGVAIHNSLINLKESGKKINAIIDGIAASAASLPLCAADTVTVYPGSLIMIHPVSSSICAQVSKEDLQKVIKGIEACEQSAAEIYSQKTGTETSKLREMMTETTWMTGQQAIDNKFADVIIKNQEVKAEISNDYKTIMINGISHDLEGFKNIPQNIPLAKAPIMANEFAKKNEGGKRMNLEELKNSEPKLVDEIAQNEIKKERERIQAIEKISAVIADQELINEAKFGANACSAQELSFRAMEKMAEKNKEVLNNMEEDSKKSGAPKVDAAHNGGTDLEETSDDDIVAVVNAYKGDEK